MVGPRTNGVDGETIGGSPGTAARFQRDRRSACPAAIVIGNLIPDEQDDEDRADQAHGQAGNVDEAVELVPNQIAQRDGHVIAKHRVPLKEPG